MKQTSKTHGLVVAPILEEVVCSLKMIQKISAAVRIFIRVQVEQEV